MMVHRYILCQMSCSSEAYAEFAERYNLTKIDRAYKGVHWSTILCAISMDIEMINDKRFDSVLKKKNMFIKYWAITRGANFISLGFLTLNLILTITHYINITVAERDDYLGIALPLYSVKFRHLTVIVCSPLSWKQEYESTEESLSDLIIFIWHSACDIR